MNNLFGKTFKFAIIISLLIIILWSFLKLTILSYGHYLEPTLYADSYRLAEQNGNNNISLLRWIFSQHNEHRITFSRLSSLIEVKILNLSIGQSGLLQNLLLVLLSSGIWAYINKKFFKDKNLKIITTLSGIILLFHPWQWENFFWEFQVPWFFINVLVLFGTLLLIKPYKNSLNKKNIDLIFVFIPWLAIFSTGQGLAAAWALSLSSFIKNKYLGIKISFSSALASLTYFYFLDYVKPERHPFNFDFLFPFVMLFGGVWHGMFILVLITCLIFFILRPKIPSTVLAPIVFPTLFSFIFSLMTTLSRSHLGLAAALSYRYTTHTLMIGLSSILLLGFIAENNNKKHPYSPFIGLTTLLITLGSFPLITFNQNKPNFAKYTFFKMWSKLDNEKRKVKDKFLCIADKAAFEKKNIDLNCDKKNFNLPYEYPENLGPDYFSNNLKVKPKGWHELHTLSSLNIKDNKININYKIQNISILPSKNLKIKGYVNANSNLRGPERVFIVSNYGSSKNKIIKYKNVKLINDHKTVFDNKLFIPFEYIIPLEFQGSNFSNISIETRNSSKIIFEAQSIL